MRHLLGCDATATHAQQQRDDVAHHSLEERVRHDFDGHDAQVAVLS
jgi:hypothetical protein